MAKPKTSDEEIRKYINEGLSNAQISKQVGRPQSNINSRINKLRNEYGELLPDPDSITEYKSPQTKAAKEEQLDNYPMFPFEPKEQVILSGRLHTVRSVGKNRMMLYENATLKGVTIMLDEYNTGKIEIRKVNEKPQKTFERITRNQTDELPEKNHDIDNSSTKILEDPIKTMEAEKSVENLFEPIDPAKTVANHCKAATPAPDSAVELNNNPTVLPMETVGIAVAPDYTDQDGYQGTAKCRGCGKELTPEEAHYYETLCESCERISMDFENRPVGRDYLLHIDKLLDLMAPLYSDDSDDGLRERTKLLAERILFLGIDKEAIHE